MKKISALFSFLLITVLLNAQTNLISLQQFSTGFTEPLDIQNCGDSRLFIVQQNGKIYICNSSGIKNATPFLDISDRVNTVANSQGLLGLAFAPDYSTSGYFFVNYINTGGNTQVSRFKVTANPDVANASSEKFILQIARQFKYHNGGCMRFGEDGYLYIASGDGDNNTPTPNGYSQDPQKMLGKMLRIDVRHGNPYKIPKSNPFVNKPGYLPEIWALGLRNPWRWSFDALTHNLIIGDVGQYTWEEIDVQPASSNGGENYGWPCYEGNHPFVTTGCKPKKKYALPVSEYKHSASTGDCSITGGFVYRGAEYANLYGKYFYTDYCSGIIRMFDINNPANKQDAYFGDQYSYTSFGEDVDHELYVTNFTDGNIYRIADAAGSKQKVYANAESKRLQLTVYPNPAKNNFSISFTAAKKENYVLHFYDAMGNKSFVSERMVAAGLNSWNIALPANIKGSCYFTLSSPSGVFVTQKVLVE